MAPVHVGGMAPKDFLHIARRTKAKKGVGHWSAWPAYIAKVGHQWYPAESATEQIMTRVGQICGLRMAESRLMLCSNQLRFLSRYFLQDGQILNHGADILSGYLSDVGFVEGVAAQRAEKGIFTFQVFCTAIRAAFPTSSAAILQDFVRMIGFDALIGNQDRHFYNWGVITSSTGELTPVFSPIYDTARGLFWNTPESGIARLDQRGKLQTYIVNSTPEIGWDGWDDKHGELNHFTLVERIAESDTEHWKVLERLGEDALRSVPECEGMIDAEFGGLLSTARLDLIKRCLRLRFASYAKIF